MFYYFVLSLPAELFSDKSIIAKALQKVGLVAKFEATLMCWKYLRKY